MKGRVLVKRRGLGGTSLPTGWPLSKGVCGGRWEMGILYMAKFLGVPQGQCQGWMGIHGPVSDVSVSLEIARFKWDSMHIHPTAINASILMTLGHPRVALITELPSTHIFFLSM